MEWKGQGVRDRGMVGAGIVEHMGVVGAWGVGVLECVVGSGGLGCRG